MEPMVGIIHLDTVAPPAFLPSEAAMRQVSGKPDVPRGPERRPPPLHRHNVGV
jgi:hypothetical protein